MFRSPADWMTNIVLITPNDPKCAEDGRTATVTKSPAGRITDGELGLMEVSYC